MEHTDMALVLAMDCSGSISRERFSLQVNGYAEAISSTAFIRAVQSGPYGRIALTFVQWSSFDRQEQVVPWMLIDGSDSATRFTAAIRCAPAPVPGFTSVSGAIDFSVKLLKQCGFETARHVIDVSGDGRNNDGRSVRTARDDAVAAGITVNGLPIIGAEPDIGEYYRREVIGGPGAFSIVARESGSFVQSLIQKLLLEVAKTRGATGVEYM